MVTGVIPSKAIAHCAAWQEVAGLKGKRATVLRQHTKAQRVCMFCYSPHLHQPRLHFVHQPRCCSSQRWQPLHQLQLWVADRPHPAAFVTAAAASTGPAVATAACIAAAIAGRLGRWQGWQRPCCRLAATAACIAAVLGSSDGGGSSSMGVAVTAAGAVALGHVCVLVAAAVGGVGHDLHTNTSSM